MKKFSKFGSLGEPKQGPEPCHRIAISTLNYLLTANALKYTIYFCHFTKKNLQYSTVIRINLFESNKYFASAVIIFNKLSINTHKFVEKYLSLLTKVSFIIILFKARLANSW